MIVVALADLHGDVDQLSCIQDDLFAADLVLLLGDLTHFGEESAARRVVRAVQEYNPSVLAVHGNCDTPETADYLEELGISLHAGSRLIDGVAFVGVGGSLPCPTPTPSEHSEDELRGFLARSIASLDRDGPVILVSHQPPVDTTADLASIGRHVGSRAIRELIENRAPLVCLCGHIHEGRGTDRIGDTWIVNPGPLRHGGYAYVEMGGADTEVEIRTWRAVRC